MIKFLVATVIMLGLIAILFEPSIVMSSRLLCA